VWVAKFDHDTALRGDTTFLKPALGAAQQVSDTQALLKFTEAAVRSHSNNVSFIKARAGAFELAGRTDSALVYYKKALAVIPTMSLPACRSRKPSATRRCGIRAAANRMKIDTVALNRARAAFAQKVDSARPYLRPGMSSPDSTQRLAAAVIMLTAGSKLAQAGANDQAYAWLDTVLTIVAPKTPADTLGPKQQIRISASFWWGISSVLTLNPPYQQMSKAKGAARCLLARAFYDRLARTKSALLLGRRASAPFAIRCSGTSPVRKTKPGVQAAFKCKPPL